jgi:hypothetical protein
MLSKLLGKAQQITGRRAVEVGWTIQAEKGSVIWDDPRSYLRKMPRPASAKSVQMCPAAIDFDARNFVVDCPVDMHLRMKMDDEKGPQVINVAGLQSNVRPVQLSKMVALVSRAEWRHPDRPIIQLVTPYLFLADEQVYMSQTAPYLDYITPPLPGVLIGGRFPINIWPRHMMWAFEWYDTKLDLVLKRGQPWFYARFEATDPSRPIRLIEADIRPEVQTYIDSISGVTNYVNRTFSLFERAKKRRPERLLYAKKSGAEPAEVS